MTGREPRQEGVRTLLADRIRTLLRRRGQLRQAATADAIHDVRVATRRLQEALEVFAAALPARESKRLRRRARRIRRCLAEVRDADVLLDLVHRVRTGPGGGAAPGIAALERRLASRTRSLRRSLAYPPGEAGAGPGLRIRGIRKRGRLLLRKVGTPVDGRLEAAAARFFRTRARAVRAAQLRARSGRATALHRLRVAVKRYRYCLEILAEWGMIPPGPGIAQARDLQDRLGAIHDLDVLIQLVRHTPAVAILRRLRADRRRLAAEARAPIEDFRPLAPPAARPSPPSRSPVLSEEAT